MVADALQLQHHTVQGYVAPDDEGELLPGIRYLGTDGHILKMSAREVALANGIGSVGDNRTRRELFESCSQRGFRFLDVLHPTAIISDSARHGRGCQFMPAAIVNSGSCLGDNVIVNSRALVEHDCEIASHVHIASGAVLCGSCTVGENVHIGAGATVIQGLTIGNGAIVAAGAVVTHSVKPMTLVAGVPAETKRHMNR